MRVLRRKDLNLQAYKVFIRLVIDLGKLGLTSLSNSPQKAKSFCENMQKSFCF